MVCIYFSIAYIGISGGMSSCSFGIVEVLEIQNSDYSIQ